MEITTKALAPDIHFGAAKQVTYDAPNDLFYSLGQNDGSIFKLSRNDFGKNPQLILDSVINDQITSMQLVENTNDLLVTVKNQLKLVKNVSSESPSVSTLYTDDEGDLVGVVRDQQNGKIVVNTSKQATFLYSSGKKIKTIYDDESEILWSGIGPICHTIVLYTSLPGLAIIDGEEGNLVNLENVPADTPNPCFAPSSDLLVASREETGVIRIFNFQSKLKSSIVIPKHLAPISLVAVTPSSKIISADREGKIYITKYDRKLIKFAAESPAPQPLAVDYAIEYGKFNLVLLSFGGGSVLAADEDGKELMWQNVIEDEMEQGAVDSDDEDGHKTKAKTTKTVKKQKTKSIKGLDIAQALMASAGQKKKAADEDESLSDMDDEAHKKPLPKPKPKPKAKPKTKKTTKKPGKGEKMDKEDIDFLNDDSEIEEDDEELPPPPDVPHEEIPDTTIEELKKFEEEEESETSSGHELSDVDEEGNRIEKKKEESEKTSSSEGNGTDEDTETDEVDEELAEMTLPFMPNSCSTLSNNRRYICWNTDGAVFIRAEVDKSEEFVDIQSSRKGLFNDVHVLNLDKYTMGTVDDVGYLLASDHTIEYRMYKPWAADAGFKRDIDNDRIELIALGHEWFAVGFSSHMVRIFTTAGIEFHSQLYSHQIIAMVGKGDFLFIVYGVDLMFDLWNMKERELVLQGEIPGCRPLKWVGMSEQCAPLALDKNLILHMLTPDFSNSWVPIQDFAILTEDIISNFWVIGADSDTIYGYPVRHNRQPPTGHLPHMREYPLLPQTLDSRTNQILKDICDPSEQQIVRLTKADQGLMKLLPDALKSGSYHLAEDIMETMSTPRARQTAITYADTLGKREFVDKLTGENTSSTSSKQGDDSKKDLINKIPVSSGAILDLPKETSGPSYVRRDSGELKGNVITEHSSFVMSLQKLTEKTNKKKNGLSILKAPSDSGPIKKKQTKQPKKKKSDDSSTISVEKFIKKD